ncbi:MAG: matrixin family metalloprotease [Deltaproteobacteria bacterium]|nr:matrixin family metalloprotease [Deltaproteobacteria bacterium]
MNSLRPSLLAAAAVSGLLAAPPSHAFEPAIVGPGRPPEVCFAPNADAALVNAYARALSAARESARSALAVPMAQAPDGSRWSYTATNGWGLAQGDPTTLTWSIVPDGVAISGAIGEPAAPSNLRAFLGSIYGAEATYLALFQQVFDRWSELTGVTYVYEPNDDRVALFGSSGALGVRADVRIGGHTIDGNYGVLAYNYYPNNGDMAIDTADNFYTNTGNNSIRLRNTIAHEHGHGLGFAHSCPINQTKLMEPYLTTAFDGPQLDEMVGGTRLYGDDLEHNDAIGNASDLGSLGNGTLTLRDLSVDDDADSDWFRLSVGAGKKASVTVTPRGATYLMGPQNPNGSCTAGTSFNSLVLNDLAVQVLDTNGTTVLGTANAHGAGAAESLSDVVLPSGAGTYYLRVLPGTSNAAQIYDVALTIGDSGVMPDDIFADDFEDPALESWSMLSSEGGSLTASASAAITGARGLRAVIDGTTKLFVQDETPDAESRYRARFWFDPNGFTPGLDTQRVTILQAFSRTPERRKLIQMMVRRTGGEYRLMAKTRLDDGTSAATPWLAVTDAPHTIEFDWRRASSPVSGNGRFDMWIDGTSVAALTGLDNAAAFLDFVRLGAVGVRSTSTGTIHFDGFVSRRTTYIGP